MTAPTDPAELVEWLERANGPSRDVDLTIMRWVENIGGPAANALHYTASLDSAMTLKGDNAVLITLSEIKGDGMPLCVLGNPATSALFEAVAATPALALCAAALKARTTHAGEKL